MATYVKDSGNRDHDPQDLIRPGRSGQAVLSTRLVEVERRSENFPYAYLPEALQRLLREAFACYSADLHLAFAILCRHAIAAAGNPDGASGTNGFERLFEDAATLSGIDATLRTSLQTGLFGPDSAPTIDADQAAVLIELVKDMFHQRYVRTAKLQRAIKVRRYFAHESQRPQADD